VNVIYSPLLRHSNAEMNAFSGLKQSSKSRLLPIIEGKRISRRSKEKWNKQLNSAGNFLYERIGTSKFIYAFKNVFDNLQDHSTEIKIEDKNPVEFLLEKFKDHNLNYIPCFDHDSPAWLIKNLLNDKSEEIAVRIRYHDLSETIHTLINNHVKNVISQFNNKHIYLIHDYKNSIKEEIIERNLKEFSFSKSISIILLLSTLDTNKDVAPMSFQKISDNNEFSIFKRFSTKFPRIIYSDYTTRLTPEPDTKAGFNINNSYLKLIYTTPNGYYLGKSEMYKYGEPENFQTLCKNLADSSIYMGEHFSLADKQILDISRRLIEVTTHQQTIELSINHHIEYIVSIL